MFVRNFCLAVWVVLISSFLSGCAEQGPSVVEVSGKITYNGRPVTLGMVKFVPASLQGEAIRPATGSIAEDGSYSMQAFPNRDGSRPGDYRVAILAYSGSFMNGTGKYLVPRKFADPQTSGLKATVPATATEPIVLDFNLLD